MNFIIEGFHEAWAWMEGSFCLLYVVYITYTYTHEYALAHIRTNLYYIQYLTRRYTERVVVFSRFTFTIVLTRVNRENATVLIHITLVYGRINIHINVRTRVHAWVRVWRVHSVCIRNICMYNSLPNLLFIVYPVCVLYYDDSVVKKGFWIFAHITRIRILLCCSNVFIVGSTSIACLVNTRKTVIIYWTEDVNGVQEEDDCL